MKIIETIKELRNELKPHRNKVIGYVPTMGYLHQGHLSLVEKAKQECDLVVMSIFVNPLQFGPNEDYDRYPRDIQRDTELAKKAGVDLIFHPSVEEMVSENNRTTVQVTGLTERLCGASRPGHFDGVTTILSKFFHIIMPDRAYFGLKDAQQVAVVSQMVKDLFFPITIVPCDTVREEDGIAMSSRNVYLSKEERKQARILNQSLREAAERWEQGELTHANEMVRFIRERIDSQPLADIDYVEVLRYPELTPIDLLKEAPFIVAVAVRFGKTRLIDNRLFEGKGE